MGKLLGLLVAAIGGLIAFHSLSSLELPAARTAVVAPTPRDATEVVPTPRPASEERRRVEQRLQRKSEARAEVPPPPVARPVLTSSSEPVEQRPEPRSAQIRKTELATKLEVEAPVEKRAPDHADLARAIQGHLARVGCYTGPVNGVWTDASQRAMKDFNARVNASLPVDKPDQVLLALVENHRDKACRCLTGETIVNGRCIPARAQQQVQRKAPVETREVRKTAPAMIAEDAIPKPAPAESWKATTKVPERQLAKTPNSARHQKPVAVPPPTVVATARQQLEQAKEIERREIDTSSRMGLGLKPATVPQPTPPVAKLPQHPQQQPPEPAVAEKQRVAVIVPPPESQIEAEPTAKKKVARDLAVAPPSSRYVRRISPPPAPVVYRTTSASYSRYLRSGAIWRRHELNGR